jgi:hypothetical protein
MQSKPAYSPCGEGIEEEEEEGKCKKSEGKNVGQIWSKMRRE